MSDFCMPSLGTDMEAGTLVEWRIRPGDLVTRGDIVAVVETEKGAIEVEIFEAGVVENIVVPEGQKVPVGTVLATIGSPGQPAPSVSVAEEKPVPRRAPEPPPSVEAAEPKPRMAPPPTAASPPSPLRQRVSPLARRIAEELGVDLANVMGTGPAGAITRTDVEKAAGQAVRPSPPAAAAARPPDDRVALRRAIAAAMSRSKHEIPHYYLGTHIDMSGAMAWLAAENMKRSVTSRLLYSVLLIRAVALAVHEVPEMNGFWVDGAFRPGAGVHVGIGISLRQGGLVAPAVHDVDKKGLDDLMRETLDLIKRARGGGLRSSELSDPTITVTNLGEQGVETVFGIIYPPQVALVGFGKVTEQPWAAGGMVGARPVIMATLAGDHRASDGHRGGRFLAAIDRLLQGPEKL